MKGKLMALLLIGLLAGCKKDSRENLIGRWQYIGLNDGSEYHPATDALYLEFAAAGIMFTEDENGRDSYNYQLLDDGTLNMYIGTVGEKIWYYSIDGNNLQLYESQSNRGFYTEYERR